MISELTECEFQKKYNEYLYSMQTALKEEEQVELPLLHDFAPGVYLRRILMPAGTFVIGKTHRTEHFNIVLSGRANVMINGVLKLIQAPEVFISRAGDKKVLFILDEMIWATVHQTTETNLDEIKKQSVYSESEEKTILLGVA